MKSSASEVRFLLVPLTREFRAPRREHSSSERSERLRTPAQGSLGDRGGCWFATPGRDPGVSRDSPVRSRSITLLLVGTTARQPRTLPCSLRELRSPQPASGLPPDKRGHAHVRSASSAHLSTSLVGIVQLARTAGLGPADGGSSPSSDSADPVRPSKLGSN